MEVACRLPTQLLPRRFAHVAGVLSTDLLDARLDDALAMRFVRSPARIRDLATLVAEEAECCSFLSFELRVPSAGPITLTVSGPPAARAWLDAFAGAAGIQDSGPNVDARAPGPQST